MTIAASTSRPRRVVPAEGRTGRVVGKAINRGTAAVRWTFAV